MTVVAQFAAPVAHVWAAYADPRQLERFWGPPEWPATFVRHDFVGGGRSEYYMTGPNGDQSPGFFEFLAIDEPLRRRDRVPVLGSAHPLAAPFDHVALVGTRLHLRSRLRAHVAAFPDDEVFEDIRRYQERCQV